MWKDTDDDNQLAMLDEDERDVDKESYEEAQMIRQLEEECQELALVDEAAVEEADDVIELVPVPPPAKKMKQSSIADYFCK